MSIVILHVGQCWREAGFCDTGVVFPFRYAIQILAHVAGMCPAAAETFTAVYLSLEQQAQVLTQFVVFVVTDTLRSFHKSSLIITQWKGFTICSNLQGMYMFTGNLSKMFIFLYHVYRTRVYCIVWNVHIILLILGTCLDHVRYAATNFFSNHSESGLLASQTV